MKTTILQTNIITADRPANIAAADELISQAQPSDLYVLPEMWDVGFGCKAQDVVRPPEDHPAVQWMVSKAAEHHCAIAGSVPVAAADGTLRNRLYFADGRSNRLEYYDKHHLFTYGRENVDYTAGDRHKVVDYCGMRFLLLTCYDLRFPCWCRYQDDCRYDAIILTANWPASRQQAWQLLPRARAIENQCWVIAANRVGDDASCHYIGESFFVNAWGNVVAKADTDVTQTLTADIDRSETDRQRKRFMVLDDRDNILINQQRKK